PPFPLLMNSTSTWSGLSTILASISTFGSWSQGNHGFVAGGGTAKLAGGSTAGVKVAQVFKQPSIGSHEQLGEEGLDGSHLAGAAHAPICDLFLHSKTESLLDFIKLLVKVTTVGSVQAGSKTGSGG